MNVAVNLSRVHKFYRDLQALNDVDFVIPKGSFFGLLGPNGAGKSTLINIMAGLVHATQGKVQIMGHDVRRQWRQARQSLGVVPQELVYDPFFTINEMLRLQSGYFGLGRENAPWLAELLDILNLSDKANANLQLLSGGMKRRVLIAQALVHKPPVVVLDEPTAGVDVELRKLLWTFTNRLHAEGHTIVLTTHYLEEAEALCDAIAILHQGKLIALDSKAALLARHPHRFLKLRLTAKNPVLSPALQAKAQSCAEYELTLRLHRQQDNISDILDALRDQHIAFTDLHIQEPGLEDVFLSLTHNGKESV